MKAGTDYTDEEGNPVNPEDVDWNKHPTKKDRFPTGDWNVPTPEQERKFHYWMIGISLFLMLVFAPYASAIEVSTFQPGDVSLFTIVENDNSYYINFTEAFYTSDFSVTEATVSINSTWGSNPYGWNDSFVGAGTADGYNGWSESTSGSCSWSWDLTTDAGLALTGSCGGPGGYSALSNSDALVQDRTYIQFFWDQAHRGDCGSGIGDNYLYLYEGAEGSDKILDLSYRCLQGVGCNYWVLQNSNYGQIEAGRNLVQIYNIDYTAYTFDIRVTNEASGNISLDETDVAFLNNYDHYDTMTFRTGTNTCPMPEFNIEELAVGDFTGLTPSELGYWNLSLDSSEIKTSYMSSGTSGENNFSNLDFSSHLTTALEDCSGSPCNIPWNLSSNGNWGNLTLYDLFIDVTTSPTTPTTLAPLNNSVYFNAPTLTCSGATDPDGDPFTTLFYSTGGGNWCDCADTESEWTGTGTWDDNCVSYANKCAMSTPTTGTYARERDYFIATNFLNFSYVSPGWGGFGSSYIDVSVDGTNILEIRNNDCQAGCTTELDVSAWNDAQAHTIEIEMVRPGGGDPGMSLEWWWTGMNETSGNNLLQNSTATTFDWSDISFGNTFNWYCKACDDTGACSNNTEPRTLNAMLFEVCTSGNIALNLTSWDEETDTALNSTIDSSLTLSSDYDSILFSNSDPDKHEHNYCLSPAGIDISTTGFFQYLPDNASYTFPRQYYLESATLNGNTTENIKLYSLTDALSTAVTFIASRAGSAVPNILIHLQRFDAGTGLFSLVATGKTSASGTDVIYLRLTDAFYRVLAYESPYSSNELIYNSGTIHITSSPYTMLLANTGTTGSVNTWYDTWTAFGNIGYSLTFNETGTDSFLLVADDTTGITSSMCLKVDKWDAQGGKQNICYDCATTSSVSISCSVPDTTSYYTAQFITNHNSDLFQMAQGMAVDLTTGIRDLVGNKDGAFYTFLLTGTAAFMALFSPMASIVLLLLGVGISYGMGILSINPAMLTVLIALGFIIIAAMYKRRTI